MYLLASVFDTRGANSASFFRDTLLLHETFDPFILYFEARLIAEFLEIVRNYI